MKIKYGNTNTFFINGLLFDTDMPGTLNMFFRAIKQAGIDLKDIKYILCSHYHPDHMGLVPELMSIGIKLIVCESQRKFVHSSDAILQRQFGEKFLPIDESKAVIINPEGSRDFLNTIGIQGEIITTESHSADGIALILDNGECFVGDIEPEQYLEGYKDNELLRMDWNKIKVFNPKLVHYGHNIDQSIEF